MTLFTKIENFFFY